MIREAFLTMQRVLKLWHKALYHRWKLIDGSAVLVVTLLALFYAYEVDVFRSPGASAMAQTAELDEMLLVAALFCGGMVAFALRRLSEAKREAARRLEAEREARTLAMHDALTGLPNRRQFDEALQVAAASPPRAGASHALLMMDLNGFKRINDLYGHQAGDDVLVQIAGRLNRVLREGDFLARLGGDEFAIVARHISDPEAATGIAKRIMEAMEPAISSAGSDHLLGVAIGVSLTPQDGNLPRDLIRKADFALYRAKEEKQRTRSAMQFFEPTMDRLISERDQLERELRAAVPTGAIRPFYQPLVSLHGGDITGFEALARWTSPKLGPIPPQRFIAVAEDSGMIGQITEMLLEQACADAAGWPGHVGLAFNVSGAVLQDDTFGLKVVQALARSGLSPTRLELEITESALVRDLEAARRVLGQLRELGVRIALDDFGTGYSSLYHLRAFKPDKIKIDRSFIDGMIGDPDNAAIVQALIGLGTGLGATVTAEGVETAEQETLLRRQGCEQGQGFLFSHALDAASALELLNEGAGQKRSA
jgi:diguanylate cyclase (GGDEF)-like protein